MAYRHFEDLTRRTVSDKILRDKALNIAKNPKYYRIIFKKTSFNGL